MVSEPSSKSTPNNRNIPKTTNARLDSSSSVESTVLWVTYLNIALYALCYQLQRPVEPFLIKSLTEQAAAAAGDGGGDSADSVSRSYGNLQSFFNTAQTLGSPLVGILLDRIGIRYTSAIVFFCSGISYAILASSYDMKTLFCSKIPTVMQAAFLVAQATASKSTGNDAAAKAAALGRMTTAYTIGATLGPALGGFLAEKGDFYIGANFAVLGSLVSVVLSLLFLPNVVHSTASKDKDVSTKKQPPKKKGSFLDELRHSGELAVRSNLWPLLMVKVLGGVTASMHSTALPLVLTQHLGFDPSQLGMSMSGSMFAVAAFGAIGMAPLTTLLGASGMSQAGLIGRAILGCVMAAIVSTSKTATTVSTDALLFRIVCVSILHSLASHALATGLTTQTTGSVDKQEQGALLGLEHSLFSLARIGGPALGTILLESGAGGLWTVESACGSLDIFLVVSMMIFLSPFQKKKST